MILATKAGSDTDEDFQFCIFLLFNEKLWRVERNVLLEHPSQRVLDKRKQTNRRLVKRMLVPGFEHGLF